MAFEHLALLHLVPTLVMAGVIWFVQVVHYPLFAAVGERAFRNYEERHTQRTTWVVLPPMVAELALATWLLLRAPEPARPLAWLGAGLVAGLWLSTFLVQVPCHARLSQGFDAPTWRRLVRSNWARTAMWTARAAIALRLCW
ncbi:MAG: hypothetical protein ACE37K_08135 [Planctomycetota bacterium]|jgi:uncharacterized membrane protein